MLAHVRVRPACQDPIAECDPAVGPQCAPTQFSAHSPCYTYTCNQSNGVCERLRRRTSGPNFRGGERCRTVAEAFNASTAQVNGDPCP